MFRGILGAALGVQKIILGRRKPILGMASHDFWNAKTRILGATPGRIGVVPAQGAPKERRRGRAEKRLSKTVFLESPFLLCPLKVCS